MTRILYFYLTRLILRHPSHSHNDAVEINGRVAERKPSISSWSGKWRGIVKDNMITPTTRYFAAFLTISFKSADIVGVHDDIITHPEAKNQDGGDEALPFPFAFPFPFFFSPDRDSKAKLASPRQDRSRSSCKCMWRARWQAGAQAGSESQNHVFPPGFAWRIAVLRNGGRDAYRVILVTYSDAFDSSKIHSNLKAAGVSPVVYGKSSAFSPSHRTYVYYSKGGGAIRRNNREFLSAGSGRRSRKWTPWSWMDSTILPKKAPWMAETLAPLFARGTGTFQLVPAAIVNIFSQWFSPHHNIVVSIYFFIGYYLMPAQQSINTKQERRWIQLKLLAASRHMSSIRPSSV